jgi:putative ubiquitin-RnfH superfamily antitoxin RatB of RatAB toxin-antitoxin module
MRNEDKTLNIEVIYAKAGDAQIVAMRVKTDVTVRQAIEQSNILQRYPEIDLKLNKVGIFSKITELDTRLADGDRIEIYRPLIVDPMEARRRRAEKHKTEVD